MELELLGPLRVDGASADRLRPAQRRVLSILALEMGSVVRTDALIERFWSGEPPARAKTALQTHISGLRKTLGTDAVRTEPEGYRLGYAPDDVDITRFERSASAASAAVREHEWAVALDEAEAGLEVWRGEPFAELMDDLFARPEITRLRELHEGLLEIRAEARLGLGQTREALPELERLVLEHPLRQRLWELLMMGRYHLGRHAEALRAYAEASERLAEAGLEPGESLRRLEERILLEDPSLGGGRTNLPSDPGVFVGREGEIAEVTASLGESRLVTLTGSGGAGKTRLAVHIGQDHLDRFGGVWLVELADLQDPDRVGTRIATAMGVRPQGEHPLDAVANALASERALIVLDNCEHVLTGASAAARRLLERAPNLHVLTTSREPLRIPGERIHEVGGLPVPPDTPDTPEAARRWEAVRLFELLTGDAVAGFTLDAEVLPAVVEICRRLGGIPLALEIAAARTRSLGVQAVADRLDDHLRLLDRGSPAGPARHRTLTSTIDWSYRLLTPPQRVVFARLGVFSGGFDLDAAEQVAADDEIPAADIAPILSDLVEKSLIAASITPHRPRYRFLDTVRQFAVDRLTAAGELETLRTRHRAWCLALTDGVWARAIGTGQAELVDVLSDESDNLQAALQWSSRRGDREASLALSAALGWHWFFTGHLTSASSRLRRALALAKSAGEEALLRSLLARCLAYAERLDDATSEAEAAHAATDAVADPLLGIWVVDGARLCNFMSVTSDPRDLLALAGEARRIAERSERDAADVLAHQIEADAASWNGHTERGLERQRMAIDGAIAVGDRALLSHIFGRSIYNYMLDPTARRDEPLRITEEWMARVPIDAQDWTSTATDWLPWVYMQSGDLDRADRAVSAIGTRNLEGYNRTIYLLVRASAAWMRGALGDARDDVRELRSHGISERWAHTFYPLAAEIAADLGDLDEIEDLAEEYLRLPVHPTGEAPKLGVMYPMVRATVDATLGDADRRGSRPRAWVERMEDLFASHPPLARAWTSVLTPRQNLVLARAELTRLQEPDPGIWTQAAEMADYAYYRCYCRWRYAEALLRRSGSAIARPALLEAYADAGAMGTRLLQRRVEETAEAAGLSLGE